MAGVSRGIFYLALLHIIVVVFHPNHYTISEISKAKVKWILTLSVLRTE